jgi:probable HAF family extracellular repeat protein
MTTEKPFIIARFHKSKTVNRSQKIVPAFVFLLGATSLSGLPNASKADEGMVNIADANGDGSIDGTASEWATGRSIASAISSDGSVIAGSASDGSEDRAFRWDATNGMVNIAGDWAIGYSRADVISPNGSVIAGVADDRTARRAFRWDATNGMVNIAGDWAIGWSEARAMSSDGSVIAGQAHDGSQYRAFRWDATSGMVNIAGDWATFSTASVISSDGSVIAGQANDGSQSRAFRWDATNGMVNIVGDWATGNSRATAMSSDGSVIAGQANDGSQSRAFRWDATNGMVNIAGEWATGDNEVLAISPDGSVITGYASDSSTLHAFRWDATNGMVNIADANGDGSIDGTASEWATGFSVSNAMSSDGSVLAGYAAITGSAPHAFRWDATNGMVNIADANGDGSIDGTASEWATGTSIAEAISSDGSVIAGFASDGSEERAFVYRSATSSGGGVMLDVNNTQTSIVQNAIVQGAAVSSVNSNISAILQTEIEVASPVRLNFFADLESTKKLPTAIKIITSRSSNKNASNVSIGSITAAVALSNELTVGGFAALGTDGTSLSGFGFDGTLTALGGFVRGVSQGNTNLAWKASIATSGGDVTIARNSGLTGTEAASGSSKITSQAASFEISNNILHSGRVISPYVRLTRAITIRDAYTEQANSFPIAYSENKQEATAATVGVKIQSALSSSIALRYGLGVDFDLSRNDAAIEGTSDIPGMTSISVGTSAVRNNARLRVTSGLTKYFDNGSSLNYDLGIQQYTYSSAITVTGSIGYTMQF